MWCTEGTISAAWQDLDKEGAGGNFGPLSCTGNHRGRVKSETSWLYIANWPKTKKKEIDLHTTASLIPLGIQSCRSSASEIEYLSSL